MAIVNSDSVPAEFIPGVSSGAESTRAPGSQGASGPAAGAVDAGPVTPATGQWQPDARYNAGNTSTEQPGQDDDGFIRGASGYFSTGAGGGSGEHFPRRPGQQFPEGEY